MESPGLSRTPTYTFSQLCRAAGRAPGTILRLLNQIEADMPPRGGLFSEGYLRFVEKTIALRTLAVGIEELRELLAKEKRILELLRFDALSDSPTWYMDACTGPQRSEQHLFLTGYDVGFDLRTRAVQVNLDFSIRDDELFAGHEMGEDIVRSLDLYEQLVNRVKDRIRREKPVLENALYWCARAF